MSSEKLMELFNQPTRIRVQYGDAELIHYARDLTKEEDLEYRRRVGSAVFKNGALHTTDKALEAPLWLFDTIVEKVELKNDQNLDELPDFKNVIPPDIKSAVANAWLGRFQILSEEKSVIRKTRD